MFGFLLLMIGLTTIASAPAWWAARKRGTWRMWDYASLVTPYLVWVVLTVLGFGSQSLGNLVEPLVLVAIIPLLVSIRVFLIDRWMNASMANSIVVFALVSAAAICLRTFVLLIPE